MGGFNPIFREFHRIYPQNDVTSPPTSPLEAKIVYDMNDEILITKTWIVVQVGVGSSWCIKLLVYTARSVNGHPIGLNKYVTDLTYKLLFILIFKLYENLFEGMIIPATVY